MQDRFFSILLQGISENRLAPYRQDSGDDTELTCYARYLWNTALSESLYPAIQGLEIALRNSVHSAISKEIGKEHWLEDILAEKEIRVLIEVRERLVSQKKSPIPAQLVASSNFGFWVSLFNSRYENVLWPKLLKEVFQYMPNTVRTRRNISRRLNRIRELRNRIFHHEPIWYRPNLMQNHDEILEAVGWVNPSVLAVVQAFDRFPQIYTQGIRVYEQLISDILDNLET